MTRERDDRGGLWSGGLRTRLVAATALSLHLAGGGHGAAVAGPPEAVWPGWGGPHGDLTAPEAGRIPEGRRPTLELVWSRPLGPGFSAIAVDEGAAVTVFGEGDTEYVAAFDPETGAKRWRSPIGSLRGWGGRPAGPASTPLIHGGRVFSLSPAGRFSAHDLETGEPLWSLELPSAFGSETPLYGFATSPLARGDAVFLSVGGGRGREVAALDAASGTALWTAGADAISYQTPSLVTLAGQTQLVVLGNRELNGFDPGTGRRLWGAPHHGAGDDSGLAVQSSHVVPGAPGRFLLKHLRTGSVLMAVAGSTARPVWETPEIKGTYTVAVYRDGYFYGYSGSIMTCVSEATGELVWRSRSPGGGSPMLLDGHLVVATSDGRLSVAPASPEGYREAAALAVFEDRIWAPASFAGDSLYVRSYSGWARVRVGSTSD